MQSVLEIPGWSRVDTPQSITIHSEETEERHFIIDVFMQIFPGSEAL